MGVGFVFDLGLVNFCVVFKEGVIGDDKISQFVFF